MAMLLVTGDDRTFEVEQLTDVDPGWQGLKVMAISTEMSLPVGSEVKIQDSSLAGSYTITYCLAPAAPRGWRLFLQPVSVSAAEPPAPAQRAAADPSTYSAEDPNTNKVFTLRVEGGMGVGVRKSVVEYKVPFSRLSQEVSRITKSGGKIISITQANTLNMP